LCCPTGLCGPVLDATLVDLSEAILVLQAEGRTVTRHQMAADPQAFMRNRDVYGLIRERQLDALPITVVRGQVVKTDAYPSLSELRLALAGGPGPGADTGSSRPAPTSEGISL
jgi:hypothetical protein